jgi:hypothetical protein
MSLQEFKCAVCNLIGDKAHHPLPPFGADRDVPQQARDFKFGNQLPSILMPYRKVGKCVLQHLLSNIADRVPQFCLNDISHHELRDFGKLIH